MIIPTSIGYLVRIIALISLLILTILSVQNAYYFSSIFLVLLILMMIYELYHFLIKPVLDVQKTISSMLQDDYSLKTPNGDQTAIYKNLAKLYEKEKAIYFDQQSIQIIYNNLLNSIDSGILILRKNDESDKNWDIFMMNEGLSKILQIPVYLSW